MIRAGVVGATGYAGVELLRIILQHPEVSLSCVTSRAEAGRPVADLFPNLRSFTDLQFSDPGQGELADCDLVFFATPNGVAMQHTPDLLQQGVKVIDLSADFRLRDVPAWEKWYAMEHSCPDLISQAVYGLPEMNREKIRKASLCAMPGCYPTAIQLGFIPLLEAGVIDPGELIADAKSGVSGAGRGASVATLYAEVSDSLKAYAVSGHRHLPEIRQGLEQAGGIAVDLTFIPHLVPMIRGIHATLYARLTKNDVDLQSLFENRFADEPFVDILPAGSHPETRSVRGSNICRIACNRIAGSNRVVVLVVEDNLLKGAAGQAVQVMNIMYGLEETTGLDTIAIMP